MPVTLSQNNILEKYLTEIGSLIGNTPLFPLHRFSHNKNVKIFAKIEWEQFGGSVKSRAAYNIIKQAVYSGNLNPDNRLLDATSGNTGIAYAHIGAFTGIPVTLFMPENASKERKSLLKALGADLRFTSRFGGTDEAQDEALALYESNRDQYFYADQYNNENNWKAHYHTTANEIIDQTNGQLTHFVSGLGTTGTFTGTGRRLKEYNPSIKLIALQPETALHGMEGWKHLETALVPGIFDDSVADDIKLINTTHAYDMIKHAARETGLLLSPSSAANLAGAIQIADEINEGVIVTVFPDNADKYSDVLNKIVQ